MILRFQLCEVIFDVIFEARWDVALFQRLVSGITVCPEDFTIRHQGWVIDPAQRIALLAGLGFALVCILAGDKYFIAGRGIQFLAWNVNLAVGLTHAGILAWACWSASLALARAWRQRVGARPAASTGLLALPLTLAWILTLTLSLPLALRHLAARLLTGRGDTLAAVL